jgi:thioredoxin reductase
MNGEMLGRYDVAIVGGGAAGLSAGLALSRALRSVLVVDAGEPRNARSSEVHGFLSREGMNPLELLGVGREDVRAHGADLVEGEVVSARQDGGEFTLVLKDGRHATARRLLVTSGAVDGLPEVPGVAERWGRDVLFCPYCHGWEIKGRALGVLANGPLAVHQALLFRQWSENVTLFLHTGPRPTEDEQEQLEAMSVNVIEGTVASLEVTDDNLTGARMDSGQVVPLDALVVSPCPVARSQVLESLGLETAEQSEGSGRYIVTDADGKTSMPGVWAAGNVVDLTAQMMTAAAAGITAARGINAELVDEDTVRAVEKARALRESAGRRAVAAGTTGSRNARGAA